MKRLIILLVFGLFFVNITIGLFDTSQEYYSFNNLLTAFQGYKISFDGVIDSFKQIAVAFEKFKNVTSLGLDTSTWDRFWNSLGSWLSNFGNLIISPYRVLVALIGFLLDVYLQTLLLIGRLFGIPMPASWS